MGHFGTRLWLFIFSVWLASSCQPELSENILVYSNDFETEDLTNIEGGRVTTFAGSKVIGNFNKENFSLHINDLPEHNYVFISFDLYIHDSWDGNKPGIDGPDTWGMEVDEWAYLEHQHSRRLYFLTTFSNSACVPLYCIEQSFPEAYPYVNDPKTGAERKDFPGFCSLQNVSNGSTRYHIERSFEHRDGSVKILFYDKLNQSNAADEKCDESWSMDNLRIRALTIN